MTLTPWRSALDHALYRNRAQASCRYLQLATINAEGQPSNRTVVFRGFVDEALQIVTDGRSEKVQQIQACPWAEVCWYFTMTREQFRLAGQLTLVSPDNDPSNLRCDTWQALSAQTRQQFYWPHPGKARTEATAFVPVDCSTERPPDSFYVLLLDIERVDHLTLRGNPQDRVIYRRIKHAMGDWSSDWSVETVNP